jgi:hypothetical protein
MVAGDAQVGLRRPCDEQRNERQGESKRSHQVTADDPNDPDRVT